MYGQNRKCKCNDRKIDNFWSKQSIFSNANSIEKIQSRQLDLGIQFPGEFISYFSKTNAMEKLFPNEFDNEGYLFYPLEKVVAAPDARVGFNDEKNILIFADYMHKSWW